MAKITNKSEQAIYVAGNRIESRGSFEYNGKIPKSLRILSRLGALTIEGDEGEDGDDEVNVTKVSKVDNPDTRRPNAPTAEETAALTNVKIIEIIKGLPTEAFMADGRPDVRQLNAELAKNELNNITADQRDVIWAEINKSE